MRRRRDCRGANGARRGPWRPRRVASTVQIASQACTFIRALCPATTAIWAHFPMFRGRWGGASCVRREPCRRKWVRRRALPVCQAHSATTRPRPVQFVRRASMRGSRRPSVPRVQMAPSPSHRVPGSAVFVRQVHSVTMLRGRARIARREHMRQTRRRLHARPVRVVRWPCCPAPSSAMCARLGFSALIRRKTAAYVLVAILRQTRRRRHARPVQVVP